MFGRGPMVPSPGNANGVLLIMSERHIRGDTPDTYWERAGKIGYTQTIFATAKVERHVNGRIARLAVDFADQIGIPRTGRVLELGCGDGRFATAVLARTYARVDAYDKSRAAVDLARATAPANVAFADSDCTAMDYSTMPDFDGAFLMSFIHHIKPAVPSLIGNLARLAPRIVVVEPNGNNLIRKALERTPSYRQAGEDSFTREQLIHLFRDCGFELKAMRRFNVFPGFTPDWLFRAISPLEPLIETAPLLKGMSTTVIFGFVKAANS